MSLTHRVGLRLDDSLFQQLQEAAAAEERTPSSLIRLLVRQHLEHKQRATAAPPMISPGQTAALHARAGELDGLRSLSRGQSKAAAMRAAGAEFGREFVSANELTFEQCSWILDHLADQIEFEKAQATE
jgi:hypothetical protein